MSQIDLLNAPVAPIMPATIPVSAVQKADGAYKTISEVAQELGVPTHVLRFWESRFPQVKPQRMRGARRYYRPEDVDVLKKIKTLLYSQGYTIKGARKHVKDGLAEANAAAQQAAPARLEPATQPSVAAAPQQAAAHPQPAPPTRQRPDVAPLIRELRELKKSLTALV